jgi:hypothetical protein
MTQRMEAWPPYLKKRLAWALELTCWKRMPPVA